MKLSELAEIVSGTISGDADTEIAGVSGLESTLAGHITFITSDKQVRAAQESGASAVLVGTFYPEVEKPQVRVEDPHYAFAVLLERFHARPPAPRGISELAYVAEDAVLGEDISIQAFCHVSSGATVGRGTVMYPGVFVGEGVQVGSDCVLYPNVVLMDGTELGNRVIIHGGTVVGADGFGYVQREGRHVKVPQVGGVSLGDDVEVGACACIDRATTGKTVIGRGTKIDNLVQIAHNVSIGEHCVIVSQVGIAGSAKIGNYCMFGGQVGLSDHAVIEDGVMFAARSGAFGRYTKGVYGGAPAVPHREFMRAASLFRRLPELAKRVAALEEKMNERERGTDDAGHQ
jgi:UDP-3-O-[3-hydroxymyristoyl] glucosamine N-acyltransferase